MSLAALVFLQDYSCIVCVTLWADILKADQVKAHLCLPVAVLKGKLSFSCWPMGIPWLSVHPFSFSFFEYSLDLSTVSRQGNSCLELLANLPSNMNALK